MDRESIVAVTDVVLIIVGVLLIILLIKSVLVSLKRGYVYINGQQATKSDVPLGFWLVILSWIVLALLFSLVIVQWAMEI